MKKYFLFLVLTLLSVTATQAPLSAEPIYGSGIVTFDVRKLPNFQKLVVDGTAHVYFGEIGEELVKVQAEQNLLPYIHTRVENDTLYVELEKGIKPSQQIRVYLGIDKLSDITTSDTVQVKNRNPLQVDSLTIKSSGISQISLPQLFCNTLDVEISGSSTVYIKGAAKQQTVTMSGATVYKALGLLTEETTISIAGAGKAWVNAKDKLHLTLSGASYLGYEGDPEIEKSITGVGRLEKL